MRLRGVVVGSMFLLMVVCACFLAYVLMENLVIHRRTIQKHIDGQYKNVAMDNLQKHMQGQSQKVSTDNLKTHRRTISKRTQGQS